MAAHEIVFQFARSCAAGTLSPSDCGPIWQLGIIGVLLLVAVGALAVLRLRARPADGRKS